MEVRHKTFRDHFLSIFQSAATDYAAATPSEESSASGTPSSALTFLAAVEEIAELRANSRSELVELEEAAVDIPKICASLGLRYLEAIVTGDTDAARRINEQIVAGTCDPRWASTLAEYAKYFGVGGSRATIPYRKPSEIGARIIRIPAGSSVAIFGDWGTGAAPARRILSAIRNQSPDILLHLGDIYYSGTPGECEANFASPIRQAFSNTPIPIFTLSGNHDMYCGGIGYYDLIQNLNKGDLAQRSSFFCLRTSDDEWQMLAMDTGLHDYSPLSVSDALTYVNEDEQDWLVERTKEFSGRTILVSHHQLFSSFSQIGKPGKNGQLLPYNPNLLALLGRLQSVGDIVAWLWGHEHNLCIYEGFMGLERGRCVGHGAVPIFKDEQPYDLLKGVVRAPKLLQGTELKLEDGVYQHGFAIASLGKRGADSHLSYFAEEKCIFKEKL